MINNMMVLTTITPETAAEMLKGNDGNRRVRTTHVRELTAAIRAGEWVATWDAIAFDERGMLINGQHRLLACVEAAIPITSYVVRGMPHRVVYEAGDTGYRRTRADMSEIGDRKVSETLDYAMSGGDTTSRVTPTQLRDAFQRHGSEVVEVNGWFSRAARCLSAAPIRGAWLNAMMCTHRGSDLSRLAHVLYCPADVAAPGDRTIARLNALLLRGRLPRGAAGKREVYLRAAGALSHALSSRDVMIVYAASKNPFPFDWSGRLEVRP